MSIYYNDTDPFCALWLRQLMDAGHIAHGDIDTRSITDVRADDLKGYTQCHFFAGIGGWAYALQLAGWPTDRPVWTGSCPCQPFSTAGNRHGFDDPRHLWPVFHRLIAQCRPPTVFGEQVASALGRTWLAGVRVDLEGLAYGVGAADLCAAGVGAPHIRQRLYWVADREGRGQDHTHEASPAEGLADAGGVRLHGAAELQPGRARRGLARAAGPHGLPPWNGRTHTVRCADGTRRASAEPGARPLADGVPARVGRLRGYGNAILPQLAATFIEAHQGIPIAERRANPTRMPA